MEDVLLRAAGALERAGIAYALMGGVVSAVQGRERYTRDVDVFVESQQAAAALEALSAAGFRTERTDPSWLYKAFWEDVLVDVIFVSKGGVRFDEEARRHRRSIVVRGRAVPALGPEDMLIIKALATAEHVPRHWYDCLGILSTSELDWAYLVRRARPHARRVTSLLLYALSEGIRLPSEPVRQLCEAALAGVGETEGEARHHLAARLRQALATDGRVNEPDLLVLVAGDEVVVSGQVATRQRREAVDVVLSEQVGPEARIRNQVEVLEE
jgi:hypothetical protein